MAIDDESRLLIDIAFRDGSLVELAREYDGRGFDVAEALSTEKTKVTAGQLNDFFKEREYGSFLGWYVDEIKARELAREYRKA